MRKEKTLLLALIGIFWSVASVAQTGWSSRLGGVNRDLVTNIATDNAGNVYAIGEFENVVDFDGGSGQFFLTSAGEVDVFVTKTDPDGNFEWAVQFGGTIEDYPGSIAVDDAGSVYLCGTFRFSADFDPGPDSLILHGFGGQHTGFIVKLNSDGSLAWAKAYTGTSSVSSVQPAHLALDAAGNIYHTGFFLGTVDLDPGTDSTLITSADYYDSYVTRLDASGNFAWGKHLSSQSNVYARSVAVNASGAVWVTGEYGLTLELDAGSSGPSLTGLYMAGFVAHYNTNGAAQWGAGFNGDNEGDARGIAVDGADNCYITGSYKGTTDFDPGLGIQNLYGNSNSSIYITKLNSGGNLEWVRGVGSSVTDSGDDIAVDADGNSYSTGYFNNTADFDPGTGTANLQSNGSADGYVLKLDTDGNFEWVEHIPSSNYMGGLAVAHHQASNNVVCGGYFSGSAHFGNLGGVEYTSYGETDGYFAVFGQCPAIDTAVVHNGTSLTASSAQGSFQWLDCDDSYAMLAGETNATFSPTANGTYAVAITEAGCADTSACFAVTSIGIAEQQGGLRVQIVPNPAAQQAALQFVGDAASGEIALFDGVGRLMYTQRFATATRVPLNVPELPGMYWLRVRSAAGELHTLKLLVR